MCYTAARVLQAFAGTVPMLVIVILHVLPPALFALLHGAIRYPCRLSFWTLMGPRVFRVPILLGVAYVGMGYLSWTLGSLILGDIRRPLAGSRILTVPLTASFIMVAWDLSMDPVWSTVMHGWIWLQGGPYFGVPVSNFLGWYLTVYVIYQLFALYLRGRATLCHSLSSGYWRLAVLCYGIAAAGNLLLVPRAGSSVVFDPTGVPWKVAGIVAASALVSIFAMGAFTLIAWVRMGDQPAASGGVARRDLSGRVGDR